MKKQVILKEATLTNNCPVCFSDDGLTLTFFQRQTINRWFRKTFRKVHQGLRCKKCKSDIHPVKWDDNLERVLIYYRKTVTPKNARFRLSWLSWLLLLALVAGGVYVLYRLQMIG